MNDYKDLIEILREMGQFFIHKEASSMGVPDEMVTSMNAEAVKDAADAIEQLVRERDEWKTLGSLANKRAEDYREMRRQRDKVIKERDAAINDISESCPTCNHKNCHAVHGCEWEWRGVQEDNDGKAD